MRLSPKLACLLAVPAALAVASCDGRDDADTPAPAPAPTPTVPTILPSAKPKPNACVPTAAAKTKYQQPCAADAVEKHKGKPDGHACYFEACAIPSSGACPADFELTVRSLAPSSAECWIFNPVEL